MTAGMSFVLCCHNSAPRLPETLAHLAAQRVPAGTAWEVVLVDNASTDGTADAARRIWGDGPAPLRLVVEPRGGLSWARLAGMRAASCDALTLVDDDNWLAPDWIERSLEVLRAHPEAGAVGGRSEADFETSPPPWFSAFATSCAIGRQAEASGDVTSTRGYLWGAGLVLRRDAWDDLLAAGFEYLLDDRTRSRLTSGGDTEICLGLRLRGWRLMYEDRLQFRHFVPKQRLAWRYFRKLYRGFGDASIVLDTYLLVLRELENRDVSPSEFDWPTRLRRLREAHLYAPRSFVKELVTGPEGSQEVLQADYAVGRIITLLRLRRRLPRMTSKIRRLADLPRARPRL